MLQRLLMAAQPENRFASGGDGQVIIRPWPTQAIFGKGLDASYRARPSTMEANGWRFFALPTGLISRL